MALGLATLLAQVSRRQRELAHASAQLAHRADILEARNLELHNAKRQLVELNDSLEMRVAERTRALEDAMSQLRQLRGLLPICMYCKKVRADKDYWQTVEAYISERTDATFSHSICPECVPRVIGGGGRPSGTGPGTQAPG